MFFLFECGTCSHLYQVSADKLNNALQKITCPACKSFYYFSKMNDSLQTSKPSIEKINTAVGKIPTHTTQEFYPPEQEVFWRCGICDSNYRFNLERVTANGIKITCNTCFQYFVLQKTQNMVDLDHVIYQEVSDKILLQKPPEKQQRDFLSTLDEKEVSGRFDISSLKTKEIQPPIKDEATVKKQILDISSRSTKEIHPFPKESTVKKNLPSRPAISYLETKELTPGIISQSEKKNLLKSSNVDKDFLDSFKTYHTTKKKFKIDKTYEGTSITFVENTQANKRNFIEKNMVKISLWIIGISIISFMGVTLVEWIKAKRALKNPPETITEPIETNPDRPKYGFPELGE